MDELRPAVESDFAAILALNDAEEQHTSAMDRERLQSLVRLSAYCKVATVDGHVAAFLIALRDGAAYENDNFGWFAARLPQFLYVDRIVVGAAFAGRGIGRRLYADLFAFARAQGIGTITCEYNVEPANPPSRAFHDRFGFRELGTQWVAEGTKRVSLQAADVGPPTIHGNDALSRLFSILHDGRIARVTANGSSIALDVDITYLARRVDPAYRTFRVVLDKVLDLRFRTWPNEAGAEPAMLTDIDEIFRPGLEILSGEVAGDHLKVICNQPSTLCDYCGGELLLAVASASVTDEGGKAYSLEELQRLCRGYWSDWESANAARRPPTS